MNEMSVYELKKVIRYQNRRAVSMGWTIALCAVIIGVSAWGNIQREQIIQAQELLIEHDVARIENLVNRNLELEQQIETQKQATIQTNRGAERTATVTAYTWTGSRTASGTWPKEGRTVAGPRNIPFGTVVWIDGIGERTVEDRTALKYDGRYDVYLDSEADCINWGIQQRTVRTVE